MSKLKNKVQLIGFVGRDPEIRQLNNSVMARFSVATNDYYTTKSGTRIEETNWHNIVLWGKQAEYANNTIRKGVEVAIEGRLVSRSYENKNGYKVFVTEISVSEVYVISKKESTRQTA